MYERLLAIITNEQWQLLESKKILLVGLGGVGGATFECLIRSGFKDITIIDGDVFSLSNLNRQLLSNTNNIGEDKVFEGNNRANIINPDICINGLNVFLTKDNFSNYVNGSYDYIIDACDDITIKIKLIEYAKNNNIPIITCLGTGRKLDATKLEVTTLNKTFNDPLAKKLRYQLRKLNIPLDIKVVFSKEEAIETPKMIGSAIFVPMVAGVLIANQVFLDIIKS